MYKVIGNEDALLEWEHETKDKLSLWQNVSAVERIRDMVRRLDIHYGSQRNLEKDLGGYTIILFGEQEEVDKEYRKILEHHLLLEDLYEFEEKYENGDEVVDIRLFLCSSDYAVVIVLLS